MQTSSVRKPQAYANLARVIQIFGSSCSFAHMISYYVRGVKILFIPMFSLCAFNLNDLICILLQYMCSFAINNNILYFITNYYFNFNFILENLFHIMPKAFNTVEIIEYGWCLPLDGADSIRNSRIYVYLYKCHT